MGIFSRLAGGEVEKQLQNQGTLGCTISPGEHVWIVIITDSQNLAGSLAPWNFMTFPSYWEFHHPN